MTFTTPTNRNIKMPFPTEVKNRIRHYVYRLIDPRNGQTFYVGKGKDDRVFSHSKAKVKNDSDDNKKLGRIKQIKKDGFEVTHIIHRHGLDEVTAREVEAALIDAYPETLNRNAGYDSEKRGMMHAQKVIESYQAEEIDFQHQVLMINVNRSVTGEFATEEEIYEAVRLAWRLDVNKAKKSDLVLALQHGLVIGVFVPQKWLEATKKNFPSKEECPGRWGFVGKPAPSKIQELYLDKRIPDNMRKKGAANPVRYSY